MEQIWPVIGVVVVGVLTVIGSWIAARYGAKPAQTSADAQMMMAISAAAAGLVEPLRSELVEARMEIVELRGHLRDAVQHMESLERILREQGVDVPRRHGRHALALVAGENVDRPEQ